MLIAIIISLIVGASVGVTVMALLQVGKCQNCGNWEEWYKSGK